MKKICILLLLAFLVPGLVGCGGKGLWGWDSDGVSGSPTSTVKTIAPKIVLNKTTLSSASIRSALNTAGAQVSIVLNDAAKTVVPLVYDQESDKTITYKAAAAIDVSKFVVNSTADKYTWNIRILINGVTTNLKMEFPTLLGGSATDATTTEVAGSITLSNDIYGNISYTYSLGYIPYGSTTPVSVSGTVPSGVKNTLPSLYVDKVTYVSGTTEKILGAAEVTDVSSMTPVFKVYFNTAIVAVPATYTFSASSGGVTSSFDNTNNLLALSLDSTKKIISVTVDGQGGTNKLKAGTKYEVTFKSATITSAADAASTATIAAGTTYKIETKK